MLFFTDILFDRSIENLILGIVLIVSLLVHELGHAFTARYLGARPKITLEGLGGNAQYLSFGMTPKQHFIITLNGPLFESLLIFVSYFLLKLGFFEDQPYALHFLTTMFQLNILWCLLNLIPILPLDGGQLVRYVLEGKYGPKGYRISHIASLTTTILVAPILFYLGHLFFGGMLIFFGIQNFIEIQKMKLLSNPLFKKFFQFTRPTE